MGVADDILVHYGIKRRSGRYPYGSGENPYQHSGDFVGRVKELRKEGLSEKQIYEAMGFKSSTEFRSAYTNANNELKSLKVERIKSLREDGLNTSQIAREMGMNESSVRSLLNEKSQVRRKMPEKTADALREALSEKKVIDIGAGVELEVGVSRKVLDDAVALLKEEGYLVRNLRIAQPNNPGHFTTVKTISEPDVPYKDLYKTENIKSFKDYHSRDGGIRWDKREYPASINSDRVMVRYGDQGGLEKDGVIELRRGVADLNLGNAHYAQVRIMVDGTHYLKGMAMYSDDLPDGVDVVFNTNKESGTPKLDVFKPIQKDPDNPFGAYIKANGQSYYDDPNGKYTDPVTGKKQSLSAINKIKEEGDWDKYSRNLSPQFLSKQPMQLIKKQLNLTYSDYESQYDEIMSYTNPTVKKKLLSDFADSCDAAAIHLKAAALPRQESRVILPISQLKDTEVYAPYLKDGETVYLVRYPHAGTFEIPTLKVNNKNPEVKKILGNATDAIGINSKVAGRLSGADFDGDTVIVIPASKNVKIKTSNPLEGLKDFEPKSEYPYVEGMKVMAKKETNREMGIISNLITDMTIRGADNNELARAVRHSMVVIDAAKHRLNYKQSEIDNDIAGLKAKYQPKYDEFGNIVGSGGASTFISKAKQSVFVPETRGQGRIDPETGKKVYKESGRTYVNKKGQTVKAMKEVSQTLHVDDVRSLSSGSLVEEAYADYANHMKALANTARKSYLSAGKLVYSPQARKTYAQEVYSLDAKLKVAKMNQPKERQALALANSVIKAKVQEYPELLDKENKKDLAKVRSMAIEDARISVGASGKETRINITPKEWEAIQAGAITDTKLSEILRYSKPELIKEYALPKTTTSLSQAKINKISNMQNSGYTIAQIADAIGVSTSTVSKYLNGQL